MTFDEFKILVKGMKAVYTSDKFLPDGDSVKIWYRLLQDLEYQVVQAAIQKYIQTEKFPPTIADIREMTASIQHGDLLDWSEGWKAALNAVHRFGMYNQQEALDSLDPMTRQVVERLGFRDLCLSENIGVERANFRMIWENLQNRERENQKLSLPLQETIKQLSQNYLMIGEEKK